jgi:cytochrome c-type biogenesis protein
MPRLCTENASASAVLALAAVFVIATLRDRHRPDASTDADPDEHPACHGPGVGAHPDNHS